MSPKPTNPQGLGRGIPFLTEAFEYKVNGTVHKSLHKESLTEMNKNSCTSTYHCQLSLLLQVLLASCYWLVPPGHWTLLLMYFQHHQLAFMKGNPAPNAPSLFYSPDQSFISLSGSAASLLLNLTQPISATLHRHMNRINIQRTSDNEQSLQ